MKNGDEDSMMEVTDYDITSNNMQRVQRKLLLKEEWEDVFAAGDVTLWHSFLTWVDYEIGVRVVFTKGELLAWREPKVFLFDIDGKAKVIERV